MGLLSRRALPFVAAAVLALASRAEAQATRTWVSGVGDDVNPCSRTAPCKTWAGAISKTAAGGEIDALDPGGFGAVTITKSITLDGHGTLASILASGMRGIVVNAGATDVVVVRGLSISGAPLSSGSLQGIQFVKGAALHVEDCLITSFGTGSVPAIDFSPVDGGKLFIKGTTIRNNAGADVLVGSAAATGTTAATIEKSQLLSSAVGVDVAGSAKVTVHDSVIAGNSIAGIRTAGTSEVNVDHAVISGNGVGVQGGSQVRLSEVMVSDNGTGLTGNVSSFANNRIAAGNGTDGAPTTVLPQQ